MSDQPVSNKDYNLVSAVYHAAQGAQTYREYLNDARQSGDQDVVSFLEQACRDSEQLAQRGMTLLKRA